MELDVRMNGKSTSIAIDKPFQLDMEGILKEVNALLKAQGAGLNGLDVRGLVPLMVRGVAGCEAGCPANAKAIVEKGYKDFKLAYVEGGILTAVADVGGGKTLTLKLFPDF